MEGDEWRIVHSEASPVSLLFQPNTQASFLSLTLCHIQLSAGPAGSNSKPNPYQALVCLHCLQQQLAGHCNSPGLASPPSLHSGTCNPFSSQQPDLLKT